MTVSRFFSDAGLHRTFLAFILRNLSRLESLQVVSNNGKKFIAMLVKTSSGTVRRVTLDMYDGDGGRYLRSCTMITLRQEDEGPAPEQLPDRNMSWGQAVASIPLFVHQKTTEQIMTEDFEYLIIALAANAEEFETGPEGEAPGRRRQ